MGKPKDIWEIILLMGIWWMLFLITFEFNKFFYTSAYMVEASGIVTLWFGALSFSESGLLSLYLIS